MVVVVVVAITERTPSQAQGVRVVVAVTSNLRLSSKVLRVRLVKDTLEVMVVGLISSTQVEVVERVGLAVMLALGSVVQGVQAYRHPSMARLQCMQVAVVVVVITGHLLLGAQVDRVVVGLVDQVTLDQRVVLEL